MSDESPLLKDEEEQIVAAVRKRKDFIEPIYKVASMLDPNIIKDLTPDEHVRK